MFKQFTGTARDYVWAVNVQKHYNKHFKKEYGLDWTLNCIRLHPLKHRMVTFVCVCVILVGPQHATAGGADHVLRPH